VLDALEDFAAAESLVRAWAVPADGRFDAAGGDAGDAPPSASGPISTPPGDRPR
jgi:hypothetical protein